MSKWNHARDENCFMEAMNVLLHGIEAELQIGKTPDNQDK